MVIMFEGIALCGSGCGIFRPQHHFIQTHDDLIEPPSHLVERLSQRQIVIVDRFELRAQCLEILGSQQENPNFSKVLLTVRQDVEGGATLADAMKKHPKVFDDLFTNMIAAGEAGGILDIILQRLAQYIEKAVKLKRAVKSASMYPAVIISVACCVVLVILWKVINRDEL